MTTKDTDNKPIQQLTDQDIINKVVPGWARALNWLYEHTFAPVDRLIDWVSGVSTRKLVADFNATNK